MIGPLSDTQTHNPANSVAGYFFDGLISSNSEICSEAALSLLQELARASEATPRRVHEARVPQRPYESAAPLRKLPPGEWRSLGGYFDYSHWADRDRFMELDRAIAAAQRSQLFEVESDAAVF